MTLEMKKVRYSSRYGYSLEWHEPASVRLSYQEALCFYTALHSELSADELDQHFTSEEQAVLHRYEKLAQQRFIDNYIEFDESGISVTKLKTTIQRKIVSIVESLSKGPCAYIQEYLGWPVLNG